MKDLDSKEKKGGPEGSKKKNQGKKDTPGNGSSEAWKRLKKLEVVGGNKGRRLGKRNDNT